MPERKYDVGTRYRYGFNGKEKDNDVKGEGNQQDYGLRIYDPRLGRFLSVDPLTKSFSMLTPYQFASNTPIQAIDLDGGEAKIVSTIVFTNSSGKTVINTLTSNEVKNPYRLGGGTLFETRISGLRGVKDIIIYTYEPVAPEKKSFFGAIGEFFSSLIKDQGYPDDGGPGGSRSHQIYGIIFSSNEGGAGTTRTGTGNDATFYDVIDAGGLFGLIKGSGGGLSVGGDAANGIIAKMAEAAEEAKGAADATSEALNIPPTGASPSTTTANTKQSTTQEAKKVTQQQTPKAIPKATGNVKTTQVATYGRKDSIGKDGSVWDVPTLTPVNKTKKIGN